MGKCPIADKKVMLRCDRGSYEVYTEENKGISVVAWRDKNVVYTLSNEPEVQPVQCANQYSSKENKSSQDAANFHSPTTSSWKRSICSTTAWMLVRSKELF
ncbi:hypothetical protein PR048_010867 [Dryococelus australis]|uniref:PiggyBac transposable element-derived protein domain-containing protein n=1 Tax=Dryococelus australis TaxID=614101 RepID=A0ABQ9I4R4_9NEOP|nr:hypothetical protein PR048_010867 [Dryococelus australis]